MKFKELVGKPDLVAIQQEMLKFWEENKIFEKSVKRDEGKKQIVFVDGPPFPTGMPHHGTVIVSFIKDLVARFFTMKGYSVPRVWGWDCHGLPIETKVEEALGLTSKDEIESKIGIAKFNAECFKLVSNNNDAWRDYVREMLRFVDYDGAYKTMNADFMESVIWAFKECYNKGLIYQDFRVTPYCTRCETGLSVSETRSDDSTRPKQDMWLMVKFNTDEQMAGKPVKYLAWTTTPWTLPSNMALAVGADMEYAYIETDSEVLIASNSAVKRYEKIFGKNPKIIKTVRGKELVNKRYVPLFDYFADKSKAGAFRVITADFVLDDEGIGIVHIAPGFGEDDYWACKEHKVPLVCPVDERGHFTKEITDFAGKHVFEANIEVIRKLKEKGLYVSDGSLVHNYPHCWRCNTPLIYKATRAWYFNIDKLKNKLIEQNEEINWLPETVKHGRFGNWLSNARDWNLSRNRYWSTPLPVWECECGHREVLGSIEEIYKKSGKKLTDLHRQYMDEVTYKCSCGKAMKRTPEVLDCWFESASVPFAKAHYPFENKQQFDAHTTCDFIAEYTGQIRCWFYYLHVLSVALFDKIAFKNCIVHGTLLAKDGKKLAKSSKNYTDPMELMKKYGTDAYRLYLFNSPAMSINDLLFDEEGINMALQQILLPLYNACSFFTSYAIIDKFEPDVIIAPDSDNLLDKWILAKLYKTEKEVNAKLSSYNLEGFVDPIRDFIESLTNFYIRRSRRRFWEDGFSADKKNAHQTLYYVLVNIVKILAAAAPSTSEFLYKHLTGELSVHLAEFPEIDDKYKNDALINEMNVVLKTIELARSIRQKANIKNRQSLSSVTIATANKADEKIIEDSKDIILEELNVKMLEIAKNTDEIAEVKYKPNFAQISKKYGAQEAGRIISEIKQNKLQYQNEPDIFIVEYVAKNGLHVASGNGIVVSLNTTITEELRQEGIARDIVRSVQDARKSLGLNIVDRIYIRFNEKVDSSFMPYILSETLGELSNNFTSASTTEVETDDGIITIDIAKKQ